MYMFYMEKLVQQSSKKSTPQRQSTYGKSFESLVALL